MLRFPYCTGKLLLYSFAGGSDGAVPNSGLTEDKSGDFYGTTYEGGTDNCGGACGTIFELARSGTETVLHSFADGTTDGAYPYPGVTLDATGNLNSTAYEGATYGDGTVLRLAPDGTEALLHSFTGGTDDANLEPASERPGLSFRHRRRGCANGDGTVFRIKE